MGRLILLAAFVLCSLPPVYSSPNYNISASDAQYLKEQWEKIAKLNTFKATISDDIFTSEQAEKLRSFVDRRIVDVKNETKSHIGESLGEEVTSIHVYDIDRQGEETYTPYKKMVVTVSFTNGTTFVQKVTF